ncbi:MAG: toll/interleukin-1 receptor domain-containing protein [Bacilli bacterium]|nr:toll/interleukin-1 receptor domain-containing protein [Bacilli bacterium]
MKALLCPQCGENLIPEGDLYHCPTCGCYVEKEEAFDAQEALSSLLDEIKLEQLANARHLLYDATHVKHPSRDAVIQASERVLSLHQDEPLAYIYLHSHDADPYELVQYLSKLSLDEFRAKEVCRWLIPSLSPRLVGPLKNLADRSLHGEEKTKIITKIEEEALNLESGLYTPTLTRDVFLAYSSADMPRVLRVMDLLEENGLDCFAAFRNMRHGAGSASDYLSILQTAMASCKVFVFLSSNNSRNPNCDALRVELPYLTSHFPDKPRVEYILDDYPDRIPHLVMKTLKNAFPSQEHCRDENDLVDRICELMESGNSPKTPDPQVDDSWKAKIEEEARLKIEAEVKAKAEAEARLKAEAEAKARKEAEEAERKENEKWQWSIAHGAFPVLSSDGKTVTYGLYPQTHVNDEALIARLNALPSPESNGWHFLDGEYYAKQSAKPCRSGYRFDDGTSISSGASYWFKCEPIEWRVLSNEQGEAFVVSSLLLDAHRYNESYSGQRNGHYANNYKESEIRKWLNADFLSSAFSLGDSAIQATHVDNSVRTTDSPKNRYACEDTEDKVLLLSYQDYQNYSYGFEDDDSLKCKTTDFAKARGAEASLDSSYLNNGYYWTRSPHSCSSSAAQNVDFGGNLVFDSVNDFRNCVRPAIRIVIPQSPRNETEEKARKEAEEAKRKEAEKPRPIADGKNPVLSEDGKTITYGLYPQSRVKDRALIAQLDALPYPVLNGWYFFDGHYYVKQKATPESSGSSTSEFDDETAISPGKIYWFECEPIQWKVLSKKNGEALVVSSLLLDARRFTPRGNNYQKSEIRKWLNSEFLSFAFSFCSDAIKTTTVDNSASTTDSPNNKFTCSDTFDKVFLLSYQDYQNYSYGFEDDDSLKCKTTEWARARGAWASYLQKNGKYWTRSPRSDSSISVWYVFSDCGLDSLGYADSSDYCVRPAMTIKIG